MSSLSTGHPFLSQEQTSALNLLNSGAHFLLTGAAGSGKSRVIKAWLEQTERNVLVTAPTGFSATLINGITCHRAFGLPIGPYLPHTSLPQMFSEQKKVLEHVDTIIVDEVSLLRSDRISAIDARLRQVRGIDLPFGSVQVIFCGDFAQLSAFAVGDEEIALYDNYSGLQAFHSPSWSDAHIQTIELMEIHRQADPFFTSILNSIRLGNTGMKQFVPGCDGFWIHSVDSLNQVVTISPSPQVGAVILCPTNKGAAINNADADTRIGGKQFYAEAGVVGEVKMDDFPIDPCFAFRIGSRVMMRANHYLPSGATLYTNGDLGYIEDADEDVIFVKLDRGQIVPVERYKFEHVRRMYDPEKKKMKEELIGECHQFPMTLGYAISITKSQGMSLDKVFLDLNQHAIFASGMLYVALSRCRSIKGLSFSRPIHCSEVIINQDSMKFMGWSEFPDENVDHQN